MDERIKALGAAVREARLAKGLSQTKLAAMIGTDQAAIARLEGGKHNAGMGTYIARGPVGERPFPDETRRYDRHRPGGYSAPRGREA